MRRSDLSPERQACLVPTPEYPHVQAFLPPATPRRLPAAGLDRPLAQAHEALGRLRGMVEALPDPDMVTRTLARREAVHSSQIEGTRSELDTLYEYECTHDATGLPADVRVTHNYVRALDQGLAAVRSAQGRQALTVDLVRVLHRELMTATAYADVPGVFRHRQNWIGAGRIEEAVFVPPPPAAVAGCMQELEASLLRYGPREDEPYALSVVVQMAIAHAQFETIHPFRDGNGRVGRLLLPLILAAEHYPPLYVSGYLHRHQRAYYDALAGVQLRGEWGPWVTLLAEAVRVSCAESIALAQDLLALRQQWEAVLADLRVDATARRLPALLLSHPITTVNDVSARLGVSFPAASSALKVLVERGLLRQPEGRRNRLFIAHDLIARLKLP